MKTLTRTLLFLFLLIGFNIKDVQAKKLSYYEKMQNRITKDINSSVSRLIPEHKFSVTVKPIITQTKPANLFLGKIGYIKEGQLKTRISKVNVYLKIRDDIDDNTLKVVKDIIYNASPVVSKNRVRIEVTKYSVNKFRSTIHDYTEKAEVYAKKHFNLLALSFFGFCLVIFLTSKKIRNKAMSFKNFVHIKIRSFAKNKNYTNEDQYGVTLFSEFVKNNPSKAITVVDFWISSRPADYDISLVYLAKKLEAKLFFEVFRGLSENKQRIWKQLIVDLDFFLIDHDKCEKFLISESLDTFKEGYSLNELTVKSTCLDLKEYEIKEFIESNPVQNIQVVEYLNEDSRKWMVDNLSNDVRGEMVSRDRGVENIEFKDVVMDLKSFAEAMKEKKKVTYIDNLLQYQPYLSLREREIVYRRIQKELPLECQEYVYRCYYPMELFLQLEPRKFKSFFNRIGLQLQAYVVIALAHEPEYMTMMDQIDVDRKVRKEVEQIKENKFLTKKIRNNAEEIEKELITEFWKLVRKNDFFYESIREPLLNWVKEQKGTFSDVSYKEVS